MKRIATILIFAVALAHLGFMLLEMVFWNHPIGHKVFSLTAEQAEQTVVLAMNQGLYNGFLAVGLIWGWLTRHDAVVILFLIFVIVAGIFGSATASITILYTQGAPALLALMAVLWVRHKNISISED